MATWPSGSKASTQYTDQPTDRIADARAEINQTIANQGEIIDMFDISSPSNGDVLIYNNSNSRFELGDTPGRCMLQYDSSVAYNFGSSTLYNGGFTIKGNANMGVSVVDSSTIEIAAGDYIIRPLTEKNSGTYGSTRYDNITAFLRDTESSGGTSIATFDTHATSFYFRTWGANSVYLNLTTTDTYNWYWQNDRYAGAAITNIAFLIEKIG